MPETNDKMEKRVREVFNFVALEVTAADQITKLNPEIVKKLEKDIERVLNKKVDMLAEKLNKEYNTKFSKEFILLMADVLSKAWAFEDLYGGIPEDDTDAPLHWAPQR